MEYYNIAFVTIRHVTERLKKTIALCGFGFSAMTIKQAITPL